MSSSDELDVGTFYPNQYKPRVLLAHHPSQTLNIRNLLVGGNSKHQQVDSSVVGKEDPPYEGIKQLAIGDIRPQEDEVTEVEVPQVAAAPISVDVPNAK